MRPVFAASLCASAASAATCVSPDALALAFGSYPPTAPSSDLCPAFSNDCTPLSFREVDCDTCGKSNVGYTPENSMTVGEGLTVSVMAKPASKSFFYGEMLGQSNAFNLGWYPDRGVSGCSPGYATGLTVGEWNHVVLRYDQAGCSLFVNGARHDGRENLRSISGRVGGKLAPAIGCRGPFSSSSRSCEGDYHFSGDRGAVGATAVWNRALSDSEVDALVGAGQDSLATAVCRKPTAAPTETPSDPSPFKAMEVRLAAVEAKNTELATQLAKFSALEAKLEQLSLLKVQKAGSMCTVQCDNGREGGILELD